MDQPSLNRQLGDYKVIRFLANWTLGERFIARRDGAGSEEPVVILDSLWPELGRFDGFDDELDKIEKWRLVKHSALARVLEVGFEGERAFVVSEYFEGRSLEALIQRRENAGESIPPRVALEAAIQIADGLACLHETKRGSRKLGLVHGGLNPTRILLDGKARVKVLGGWSSRLEAMLPWAIPPRNVVYQSPEELWHHGLIEKHADMWSLGVVLFEVLAGRFCPPEEPLKFVRRVMRRDVNEAPGLGKLPPQIQSLLRRLLEVDPAQRVGDCREVADELRNLLAVKGAPAKAGVAEESEAAAVTTEAPAVGTELSEEPSSEIDAPASAVAAPEEGRAKQIDVKVSFGAPPAADAPEGAAGAPSAEDDLPPDEPAEPDISLRVTTVIPPVMMQKGASPEETQRDPVDRAPGGEALGVRPPDMPAAPPESGTQAREGGRTQSLWYSEPVDISEPTFAETEALKVEAPSRKRKSRELDAVDLDSAMAMPPQPKHHPAPEKAPPPVAEPPVEELPESSVAPVTEDEPVAEDAVERSAIAEEAPIAEQKPVVEEAPIAEQKPVVEEAPIAGQKPVVEDAPIAEQEPVAEEAPIAEPTPVAEEAPIAEPTPELPEPREEEDAVFDEGREPEKSTAEPVEPSASEEAGPPGGAYVEYAEEEEEEYSGPLTLQEPFAGKPRGFLIYREGSSTEYRYALTGDLVTLGRSSQNTYQILSEIKASRFHCEFQFNENTGNWYLVDKRSTNGTYVNGHQIEVEELKGREKINIGFTTFRFLMADEKGNPIDAAPERLDRTMEVPKARAASQERHLRAALVRSMGTPQETHHEIVGDVYLIGSASGNSLQLEDPLVAPCHCEIRYQDGCYVIEDHLSEHGTLVNGFLVDTLALDGGEEITVGSETMRVVLF